MMWVVMAVAPVKNGYEIGDLATDFNLKNVDGKMVRLANYTDARGYIVVFDCNTCPYSKAYNTRLLALDKKYAPMGYPVIAINANTHAEGESMNEMIAAAKSKNYSFPYLADEDQSVARTYGATNTPHVFVLQKTPAGLKVAYIGTIDDNARNASKVKKNYVQDAVNALLEGREVTVTKTKAIGCGIKWKDA